MKPLKVGWLTSWSTTCGIAEYSRYVARAMWQRDDVDFHILGSRNYGARALPTEEYEPIDHVHRVFDVELWNDKGKKEFDINWVLEQNFDVLHVQYEIILYPRPQIYDLFEQFNGVRAITYHDNCFLPNFPYFSFDLRYTHREDVGLGDGYLLPMGIENRLPVVKTFGLGRSREDLIAGICHKNNWLFEKSFGEQQWKSQDDLYSWLRDSDAIVLYYEDASAAGTSIAARVAISTRRPVFVNDVTWFKDLTEESISNLSVVSSPLQLESKLVQELNNNYIDENNWERIADTHMADYRTCLT